MPTEVRRGGGGIVYRYITSGVVGMDSLAATLSDVVNGWANSTLIFNMVWLET